MRVQFSVVGQIEPVQVPSVWMDVIPREGDAVKVPGLAEYDTIVRTVVWYPFGGDASDEISGPFVYVVLGAART